MVSQHHGQSPSHHGLTSGAPSQHTNPEKALERLKEHTCPFCSACLRKTRIALTPQERVEAELSENNGRVFIAHIMQRQQLILWSSRKPLSIPPLHSEASPSFLILLYKKYSNRLWFRKYAKHGVHNIGLVLDGRSSFKLRLVLHLEGAGQGGGGLHSPFILLKQHYKRAANFM